MIGMQLLGGVLLALAVLVGAAIALAVAMTAAASTPKPGPAPHGGIPRDLEPDPQPYTDDARELVLR